MESWEEWQIPYQYGTIVLWPPDEIREFVNAQRERYDPVSQSICGAHVTVTQPFARGLDAVEWEQVNELLQGFESFELHYGPINSFLPYPCIWYEIHPTAKVLEIRAVLHETGFFNLEMKHPKNFIPHMTITEGQSGPEVNEKLLERLQGESRAGSYRCVELAYIVPNEHFQFEVVKKLPLAVSAS